MHYHVVASTSCRLHASAAHPCEEDHPVSPPPVTGSTYKTYVNSAAGNACSVATDETRLNLTADMIDRKASRRRHASYRELAEQPSGPSADRNSKALAHYVEACIYLLTDKLFAFPVERHAVVGRLDRKLETDVCWWLVNGVEDLCDDGLAIATGWRPENFGAIITTGPSLQPTSIAPRRLPLEAF